MKCCVARRINIISTSAAGLIRCRFISTFYWPRTQTRLLTSSLLFLSHVELERERARLRSAANGLHYSGRCPIKEFLKLVLLSLLRASARDPHYWRIVRDVKWISHGRLTSRTRVCRLGGSSFFRVVTLDPLGAPIFIPRAPDVIIRRMHRGAEA